MISARQLAGALYGLWLLYRFDVRAWDFFEKTPRGFWTSYVVAFALAPLQLAHMALLYETRKPDLDFAPYMIVQTLAYIVTWTLFPFVMLYVSRLLEREPRYLWHMVPYNWMQLPLALTLSSVLILTDLGVLPAAVIAFVGPVILVAIAVYGTFVAAIGLQVVTGTALSLVVLDYLLSLIVGELIRRI
jgi:hypothetical protein